MRHPPSEAGFLTRALALSIDIVVIGAASSLASWFMDSIATLLPANVFVPALVTTLATPAATLTIAFTYTVGGWRIFGATLGKMVVGLRVTGADGAPPSLARGVLRYALYWLSAAPLFLGFVWVFVDPHHRTWHDYLSGTAVVRATATGPRRVLLRRAN